MSRRRHADTNPQGSQAEFPIGPFGGVRPMHPSERQLEYIVAAYRRGELDECVRWVRKLVNAAPRATAPRQLLAAMYHQLGEDRLALFHYGKLLPQALKRGELFRAIAIQKRIDPMLPAELLSPTRWRALRKRCRPRAGAEHAEAALMGRAWVESQLLELSDAWFERVALESRLEMYGGASARVEEIETPTVWEVVAGRLRWSCALPDGRKSGEVLSAESDTIQIHPELADRAWLSFSADLPVECLRFDPELARELPVVLHGGHSEAGDASCWVGLGTGSRRRTSAKESDQAARAPMTSPGFERGRRAGLPHGVVPPSNAERDTGDWLDFGMVDLPIEPGSEESIADRTFPAPGTPAGGAVQPPMSSPPPPELPWGGEPVVPAETRETPASGTPAWGGRLGARDSGLGEGFDLPVEMDPFAAPMGGLERPVERRRQARVAVSFETRMAVLRLRGARAAPIRGELIDLSAGGLGVRVTNTSQIASCSGLEHAVLAIELAIPGPGGPLQVAGQVRRVQRDRSGKSVRVGIEFVLMTEPDRRRIASILASAALDTRARR